MKMPLVMTPGPTYVSEEVRRALSMQTINPDLDPEFFEYYRETSSRLKQLLNTENDVLILSGEGILGLEAACASVIEPGDRVLCIDNGIYGNGFGDFARMYGAEVVYFKSDYRRGIDVEALRDFLEKDNNFRAATLVHCETPSGMTNPVDKICPILNKYGIISIVDSVSGIGGENLKTDEWNIDIVLGGSQKCLSAPPGITFLSVSSRAWNKILNRKIPVAGYYVNLSTWKNWYEEKWFPYTQATNDIYALRAAVDRLLNQGQAAIERHAKVASAVRASFDAAGLELYPLDSFSNTVTTVLVPEGITSREILEGMLNDHNILIAGAFDFLKDKVFRIGHMGENCYEEKIYITLKALNEVLIKHGVNVKIDLHRAFISNME